MKDIARKHRRHEDVGRAKTTRDCGNDQQLENARMTCGIPKAGNQIGSKDFPSLLRTWFRIVLRARSLKLHHHHRGDDEYERDSVGDEATGQPK